MTDTNQLLQKIAAASATLNATTDQLNAEIDRIEDALNDADVGVTANVGPCCGGTLLFGKANREWGLQWAPSGGGPGPLRNAPRHARVEAIRMMPELLQKLLDATLASQKDALEALDVARKLP